MRRRRKKHETHETIFCNLINNCINSLFVACGSNGNRSVKSGGHGCRGVDRGRSPGRKDDDLGNIVLSEIYAYSTDASLQNETEVVTYNYGTDSDAGWNKLLKGITTTTYNEDNTTSTVTETIDYDAIGNPISYRGATMGWYGRQMTSYSKNGTTITNTYDVDGIRGSKTVNGSKATYQYISGKLYYEKRGDGRELYYYYDSYGNLVMLSMFKNGNKSVYYVSTNSQGDVLGIYTHTGVLVASYEYDAWGNTIITKPGTNGIPVDITNSTEEHIGLINPIRYRGYYYDADMGLYYVSSRYYDPEIGRVINAADIDYLGADGSPSSYNLFAYCMNNPVNRFDANGNWSLPNWAKVAIGAAATVAAVAVTVATGGAAAPVLLGVAASTIGGAAVSAVNHRVTTGSWEGAGKAALDGAADGFMTGGLCALGGSVVGGAARTIKNAKSGITIGKVGTFEDVAALAKTRHYSGLKEFNFIKKVAGQKAAETVGWWQNKCVVKGVMALKGAIYDCGGALTGAYAKEVALTRGYQYLYNVWLM